MDSENTNLKIAVDGVTEYSKVPLTKQKMLVMSHLESPNVNERTPVGVNCVIDTSGSMSGRLGVVSKAVDFIVNEMSSKDRLGLGAFNTFFSQMYSCKNVDTEYKEYIKKSIRLHASGRTNLGAALSEGIRHMRRSVVETSETKSVWLFTDGHPTEGETNPSRLTKMVQQELGVPHTDVRIYTFGLGADHDANLLRNVAEAGDGFYYYLSNINDIGPAFAECLGGLTSTVATNITVTITCREGVTITKVLGKGGLKNSKTAVFSLKDLFSEEKRDLMVEVELDALPSTNKESTDQVILDITVQYINSNGENVVVGESISVNRSSDCTELEASSSNAQVDEQRNRLLAADGMEQAKQLADQGQFAEAHKNLSLVSKQIAASRTGNTKFCNGLVQDIVQCQAQVTSKSAYINTGSKLLNQAASSHNQQRCSHQPILQSQMHYQTQQQHQMQQQQQQQMLPPPLPTAPMQHQRPHQHLHQHHQQLRSQPQPQQQLPQQAKLQPPQLFPPQQQQAAPMQSPPQQQPTNSKVNVPFWKNIISKAIMDGNVPPPEVMQFLMKQQ